MASRPRPEQSTWRRRARTRCASISARTCRRPTSAPRSRPATWASCTPSPPARRSTGRASGWSPGPPPACSAANIATTPTPGRLSNGIPVTLERAIEGVRKYANGLKPMNGGFTLSGGEPLMQDRFAVRLFAAVKAMGVHTAIETNGFYGDRLSDEELKTIDLVILDMKAFTLGAARARHRACTNSRSARLLHPPRRAQAADVAALRARAGPDRRSRRKWKQWRSSPRRSASSSASRSCRSTSWASTSGRRLELDYKLADTEPPTR